MWELERARQGGVGARKELWSQADGEGLRPAQESLSQGVEERRPGSHPPCEGKSPLWRSHKRQPLCDLGEVTGTGEAPAEQRAVPWRCRQCCLFGVPQAGSDLTVEMGAPTHFRGV